MKFSPVLMSLLALSAIATAQTPSRTDMSPYGGPSYNGDPALDLAASLVNVGGGRAAYSTATAFTSMLGQQTIAKEMIKLRRQYGEKRVKRWLDVFDFAIDDSVKQAGVAGTFLPKATMSGRDLARAIVSASMDDRGTVWSGRLFDKAFTHSVELKVLGDVDAKFGFDDDRDFHRITDQALYDIGIKLDVDGVRLAKMH